MSDWEGDAAWDFLWGFAGLPAPNLHIDDIGSLIALLSDVSSAVAEAAGRVTGELRSLQSGTSSLALDAISAAWHSDGVKAVDDFLNVLFKWTGMLGQAQQLLYRFKKDLVISVGAVDGAEAAIGVVTLGMVPAVEHLFGRGAEAAVRTQLEQAMARLESQLLGIVVENTPVGEVPQLVSRSLAGLARAVLPAAAPVGGRT